MILVITGRSESMHLTTNGVGIGSSLQDVFAELSINLRTSFSDSCEKRSIMLHGRKQQLLDAGRRRQSRGHVVKCSLNVVDLLYKVATHLICKC